MNTPFSQFMDATTVVRKVVKYVFITWALVLGIVTLVYLPSFTIFRPSNEAVQDELALAQETTESDNGISTNTSMTPKDDKNIDSVTLADQLQYSDPQHDNTVEPLNSPTDNKVQAPSVAAAISDSTKSNAPLSTQTINVSAYKATLFSAIDTDQPTQTPIQNGAELLLIETKNEWMKVKVSETGVIGFIHASQVE